MRLLVFKFTTAGPEPRFAVHQATCELARRDWPVAYYFTGIEADSRAEVVKACHPYPTTFPEMMRAFKWCDCLGNLPEMMEPVASPDAQIVTDSGVSRFFTQKVIGKWMPGTIKP